MNIKTPEELASMREGGKKLGVILQKLLDYSKSGISLLEIEKLADRLINESGGTASFQTVEEYKWATCLCVNDVVVHGIPTEYILKDGDVLTIDVGLLYKGLHTDTAWTKIIQNSNFKIQNVEEKTKFLKIGEEALWNAIEQAKAGNRTGHISRAIQDVVERAGGYKIVRTLVGHGVGKTLHEAPQVPGVLKDPLDSTPLLEIGMTIAIEVIYGENTGAVVYVNDDGWSIGTKDGSLSSVFEHTIEITPDGPVVLTRPKANG